MVFSKVTDVKELHAISKKARIVLIETLSNSTSGHTAGPLGLADVFTCLYYNVLNHRPSNPEWKDRDFLFLSNGHVCPIRYTLMALTGYFPLTELKTLRKINSRLQGHPSRVDLPGVENSSGPLGQGISQACGSALILKREKLKNRVYCIMSDGELQEGQSWEALMFAGNNNLPLTIIVDRNRIQIDGNTEQIMPLEPLKEKFKSFNLNVMEVDAHNHLDFIKACNTAKTTNKTTLILCNSIPGKGVSFMEGKYEWHGKTPNKEEAERALKELRS